MRGYYLDSLVPQDYADQIQANASKLANDPTKYTIADVAIRGGNLMINPRAELRVPVHPPFDTVVFVDAGNIWQNPTYIFQHGIPLRWNAGTGLRIETPIGPLAFDYGFNLSLLFAPYNSARKSYEVAPGSFNFSIGLF